MGRKSKKKGGKKSSDRGGKKGNAAAASKPKSVSEFAAGLKARSAEFKELLSNEEKLKGVSEDDLALCHALHVSSMLKVAELGGDLDEESHAASLKYCEENADMVFEDGGANFRRRLDVQVKKRKEKKKFEEDMEKLEKKGDQEGRLRLLQARMRSEGLEEHCADLLHCTLIDDELFADPPPQPECPICMLTLPGSGRITYQPCCGKVRTCPLLLVLSFDACPHILLLLRPRYYAMGACLRIGMHQASTGASMRARSVEFRNGLIASS